MSDALLCVESHHLARSVIVDLVHLLYQWSYTHFLCQLASVSSKLFMSDVLLRVVSDHLAQLLIADLVHLLLQRSYTQVSFSIYEQ
jgi:hypothetical protein